MLQAVMTEPGKIVFQDVPLREPGENEVLIRMMSIGVCGSDIHVWHGKHPYTSYPVVQGHEVSGEVVKAGNAVLGLSPGDRVTVQPQVVCGTCWPCVHGSYHICDMLKVMGFQTTGMASEYFAVEAAKVLKLPSTMDFDEAAMVEPLAVAVHALVRGGGAAGRKVLVLGAGPIGNLVAQAARAMGAAAVMITDVSDFRLEMARQCGIDSCANTAKEDLAQALPRHFGPDRADLILDCAGATATIGSAVACARKGSTIVVVAVFGHKPTVDLGLVQDRELTLTGTLMYCTDDYEAAIDLIGRGAVQLSKLITNRFPFREYEKAYRFIEEQGDRAMKVIIRVQE